jgi:predicted secreted hydrolase
MRSRGVWRSRSTDGAALTEPAAHADNASVLRRRPLLIAAAALPAGAALAAEPPASSVRDGRALVFPRDFGAHPEARTEWWYATGWLQPAGATDRTPTHGFQVTFFRARGIDAPGHPSRFAATQLVFAHAALTDLGARAAEHDQRIARAGFGIASFDERDTAVALRDWRFRHDADTYRTQLRSEAAGFAFDFSLAATQPTVLQGGAGHSRKGPKPEQASHYYSRPQLAVAGTLTQHGTAHAVQGRAWLDHEWSDAYLAPEAVGWDWIGFNLFDGGALMAFRIRRRDGSAHWAGGSFRAAADAPLQVFAADAVRFTPGRTWPSAATQARYPVEWTVATPAGPFGVRALLDAQELDSRRSTGAVYWEGLSELLDAQGTRIGLGYLEMTGYADRLRM